jgi:hypothetical protein
VLAKGGKGPHGGRFEVTLPFKCPAFATALDDKDALRSVVNSNINGDCTSTLQTVTSHSSKYCVQNDLRFLIRVADVPYLDAVTAECTKNTGAAMNVERRQSKPGRVISLIRLPHISVSPFKSAHTHLRTSATPSF